MLQQRWFWLRLSVLSLAVVLAGSGCLGASTDGSGDDALENELRIKPDAGENLARLTIVLPTGTCVAGGSCTRPLGRTPSLALDSKTVALGTEQRIIGGDHTVSVDGLPYSIRLSAGQKRTLTLAVAHRKCVADSLPSVSATDFGSTPTVRNVDCPTSLFRQQVTDPFANGGVMSWFYGTPGQACTTNYFPQWNRAQLAAVACSTWASVTITGWTSAPAPNGINTPCRPINVNGAVLCDAVKAGNYSLLGASGASLSDADFAYAPGTYDYSLPGASTLTSVTLSEGSLNEIPIRLPVSGQAPTLFTTALVLDDARELPDAAATTIVSSLNERSYTLPATATGTVNLSAYVNSSATYTLKVNGRTVTLDQTRANRINLKRLDIDDVTVTREDNTTYQLRGTFEVYFGGTRIAGPYNTNTGIDMLPGDYEVVIKYRTAEGDQVDRRTFTL